MLRMPPDTTNRCGESRKNRKARGLSRGEFLGGFRKEDRLNAIFTIVLYYGAEPWDGAGDLYSLINFEEIPEGLKNLFNNYRLHVLRSDVLKIPISFRPICGSIWVYRFFRG